MSGEFLMGYPRRVPLRSAARRRVRPARRRATSVVLEVFAEFGRAVEGGDPHESRLVDPVAPTRDIAQGRDVRVCATESRPAARADLTGSLMSRPRGKAAGPVAHAGPSAPETPRRSLTPDSVGGADRK